MTSSSFSNPSPERLAYVGPVSAHGSGLVEVFAETRSLLMPRAVVFFSGLRLRNLH